MSFEEKKKYGSMDAAFQAGKAKYSKGEAVECVHDYIMRNKSRAFTSGNLYSISDVIHYDYVEYVVINDRGDRHSLEDKDIDFYFKSARKDLKWRVTILERALSRQRDLLNLMLNRRKSERFIDFTFDMKKRTITKRKEYDHVYNSVKRMKKEIARVLLEE